MRILLVYPNANKEIIGWGDLGAIAEPLALEYLAAGGRLEGHDVQILDLRLRPHHLDLVLLAYQPDVVGVTGYSMHVLRNLAICRRARQLLPHTHTVVGGHHATLLPEDFFDPCIDYVVVGEGVQPFRRVLRALDRGEDVRGVPGVWSRVDGAVAFGGEQPALDIDSIPFPDRSETEADRSSYYIDWMKPIALMRTTVGCPYRCSFCALWRIMDGRYHKRACDRVVEELRQIPEHYVFLVDDEPFVNVRRMRELAQAIRAASLHKEYFAYCRIDSFLRDRGLMESWRELGLRRVFFGIETIFANELKDYNKRQQLDQIIEALRVARSLDIAVFANFIIRPDYSAVEFAEIVKFIERCEVSYPSFTILTPIPGTEANFDAVLERQPNGRPNWEYFDLQHPVTKTRLPKEEFMLEYRNLWRVFANHYRDAQHPFHLEMDQVRQSAPAVSAVTAACRPAVAGFWPVETIGGSSASRG